jgi:hypothetical protein
VPPKSKCKLGVCICLVTADDPYCSDYCRQASSQGTERDFCQCGHSVCSKPAHIHETVNEIGLPTSISLAPGLVTIEYSDNRDLRDQLILLATKLETEVGAEAHPRFADWLPLPKRAARAGSA